MTRGKGLFKRCLHSAVFSIWTGFLIYLIASRRYVEFLRPEFGVLLVLAHFIAMAFALGAMVRKNTTTTQGSDSLRCMVLLVPIVYFILSPQSMLGNQAFKKRFTGLSAGNQIPGLSAEGGRSPSNQRSPTEGKGENAPLEKSLRDILMDPSAFQGRRVSVTGMVMRDEKFKAQLDGRDTVVYRFLITCCAADAIPLVIVLDSGKGVDHGKDQWFTVEGIFTVHPMKDAEIPMINQPRITPVEAPQTPYLF